jgi:hypothetical protein
LYNLQWFKFNDSQLKWLNIALCSGLVAGSTRGIPVGWLRPKRQQLATSVLEQRCTITWEIPRAGLEAALYAGRFNGGIFWNITSPPLYLAGTAIKYSMSIKRNVNGATDYALYAHTAHYTQHDTTLCFASCDLSCNVVMQRQVPGQAQLHQVFSCQQTLTIDGRGRKAAITTTTPSDLEPYLVDGCLKLKATVRLV